MQLNEAINASDYVTAAAEHGANEVIVGAYGQSGSTQLYNVEEVTSTGKRMRDEEGLTVAEVEAIYPDLNWWPMREQGEWGEQVEATIAAGGSDGDESTWDEDAHQQSVRDMGTDI